MLLNGCIGLGLYEPISHGIRKTQHVSVSVTEEYSEAYDFPHLAAASVASDNYHFGVVSEARNVPRPYGRRDNSDNADSVDLFVLPGVSAERSRCSEPASSTSLLPDMVGVPAAPSASDMGTLSSSFPERCGPFCHEP